MYLISVPQCSQLSTPPEHTVAVSGSLGAGCLDIVGRMMTKRLKLKMKGPAALLMLNRLRQSVVNQSSVKRQCVLPGAVLGTCTAIRDGLHGPAVLLHTYDHRNYFVVQRGT